MLTPSFLSDAILTFSDTIWLLLLFKRRITLITFIGSFRYLQALNSKSADLKNQKKKLDNI